MSASKTSAKLKRKKPRGTARVGALIVLAACFGASAIIRTGEVIAALPGSLDDGFGNPIPSANKTVTSADDAASKDPVEPDILLAELKRQRKMLQERESKLKARQQKLDALETRLKKRLDDLRAARKHLSETAALVDDAADKDVKRLAEMYQQMKPKQAGQIFNEMAPSFAAGFMAQMRPDAAALIMSYMEPAKAYAVSVMLAGRNVEPDGSFTPAK